MAKTGPAAAINCGLKEGKLSPENWYHFEKLYGARSWLLFLFSFDQKGAENGICFSPAFIDKCKPPRSGANDSRISSSIKEAGANWITITLLDYATSLAARHPTIHSLGSEE